MKKINLLLLPALFIINPAVSPAQDSRLWATYCGGMAGESGVTVASDAYGNTYLAGITMSTQGIAFGGFQTAFGGGIVDAYIVKVNAAGTRLWSTYYGGNGDEMTFFGGKIGLAADGWGNVYLAGLTNSTTGIATANGFQNTAGGAMDAYLVKFDSTGSRLWATYYGGAGIDYGYNVACDPFGNVFLTGLTQNATGIASGGFQNSIGGMTDAFLVKFDSAGNRIWSTYYGGTGSDEGFSMASDASGNVFLAGSTDSPSGIASGGFQNGYGGGAYDAFLAKFDSAGSRIWATYYGGAGDEMMPFAGDIDVEVHAGSVYLSGLTTSTSGIASGGFQNTFGGTTDAFLVKFNATSGAREWATYYGGADEDKGYNVAADGVGDVYLAGHVTSATGIASGGFQNNYAGSKDAFLAKFNPEGNLLCATYYGGPDYDSSEGLDIDNAGNPYVSGGTANASGIATGGFQNFFGGGTSDAYLVKFSSCQSATSIGNLFDEKLNVYPNPSDGEFKIALDGMQDAAMEIYDCHGKKIFTSSHVNQFLHVSLNDAAKGLYFVRITDNKRQYITKLIIE